MENPFNLSDEKLKILLNGYFDWSNKNEEQKNYPGLEKQKSEERNKPLLNKENLSNLSDEKLIDIILKYVGNLEGPVGIKLNKPKVIEEISKVRRNILYIINSQDTPFKKVAYLISGDYRIKDFSKSFWSPLLRTQHSELAPNWNNKTDNFLKKLGINLTTSKKTTEEKYKIFSEAYLYLKELDNRFDFYTLDHLTHYGTVIPEGIILIDDLQFDFDYWVNLDDTKKLIKEYADIRNRKGSELWNEEYKWDILPKVNNEFIKEPISIDNIVKKIDILIKYNPTSGSFVHWSNLGDLEEIAKKKPEIVMKSFKLLFEGVVILCERIDNAVKELRKIKKEAKINSAPLIGYLFAMHDYKKYPLYKDSLFQRLKENIGKEKEWKSYTIGMKYQKFQELCLKMGEYLKKSNLLNDIKINDVKVPVGITALDGQDFFYYLDERDKRNSIYIHLNRFIKQAESDDLTTRSYPRDFKNYEMKVGFGQGTPARIPWIAFLGEGQKVTKGIYPVYLYYKKIKKLILAYGVSETQPPEINWEHIDNAVLVDQYYQKEFGEKPYRYGNSYVFKVYDVKNINNLKKEEVDNDLNKILEEYRDCFKKDPDKRKMKTAKKIEYLHKYILSKGFNYSLKDIANFYLSLKTKPFVILAGISGTGKTQLARKFAEAINAECELIPVKPDWTDNSDLIGYVDINNSFKKNAIIKTIENATSDSQKIYIVLLDEMNLARVEHYFSDFLSIIETREYEGNRIVTKNLITDVNYKGEDELKELIIPENVYIVGTVNMDETTHPFSRKVLDRANSIELNQVELDWINNSSGNMEKLEGINNEFLKAKYIHYKDLSEKEKEYSKNIINTLKKIDEILKEADFQIGYRIRDELCFYMLYQREIKDIISYEEAFDFQIMQKILPRIQGSSSRVKKIIVKLIKYLSEEKDFDENYSVEKIAKIVSEKSKNRRSIHKLLFMLRRYEDDGFTSFWI
jgi:MoxR-like ATPase